MRVPRRGVFLVLEGPDKSGKSTHAKFLVDHLRRTGLDVVHTREPGGTGLAEAIRKALLDTENKVHPLAELLLYEAARAQHTHEVILPALKRGAVVLSERFTLATLAYQGYARGLGLPLTRQLNRIATGGLTPDLTIIIDIPEKEFHRRDTSRRHDRLEKESDIFRRKVRNGYLALAKTEPKTTLIDGSAPLPTVQRELARLVSAKVPETAAP